MTIKFLPFEHSATRGKLADAELHFDSGPLVGLKLVGFAVWETRAGLRNVTFPSRTYSVNGERRSFALLRPVADTGAAEGLRGTVLDAFRTFEQSVATDA